jgi:hypothetical protein
LVQAKTAPPAMTLAAAAAAKVVVTLLRTFIVQSYPFG